MQITEEVEAALVLSDLLVLDLVVTRLEEEEDANAAQV